MTLRLGKQSTKQALRDTVHALAGVDLSGCYQCRKCDSGCPVAGLVSITPSELLRRIHLGAGDELLASDLVWMCASCETCVARCPMSIDIPAAVDALRMLAVERKAPAPEGNMPLFNRAFLATVKIFGRTYDLAMVAAHKVGTRSFAKDTEKLPAMLKKRKIALLPPRGADRKTAARIFASVRREKGRVQ